MPLWQNLKSLWQFFQGLFSNPQYFTHFNMLLGEIVLLPMAKIEKIIKASSHILLGSGANVVVVQRAEWSLLRPDLQFISSLG